MCMLTFCNNIYMYLYAVDSGDLYAKLLTKYINRYIIKKILDEIIKFNVKMATEHRLKYSV